MRKVHALAFALLFVSVFALTPPPAAFAAGGDSAVIAPVAVGTVVGEFKLPDAAGAAHTLSSLKGKHGTVLIFMSTKCPVSNAYNARMEKLAQDYKARGVNVVGVNANATETIDEMKAFAAEKGLTFTILKDKDNKLADKLGAGRTPEVFFLDAANKLVYHGAIDNAQSEVMVNAHHLRNAIDATIAGQPITKTDVKAFGCSIKRAS